MFVLLCLDIQFSKWVNPVTDVFSNVYVLMTCIDCQSIFTKT